MLQLAASQPASQSAEWENKQLCPNWAHISQDSHLTLRGEFSSFRFYFYLNLSSFFSLSLRGFPSFRVVGKPTLVVILIAFEAFLRPHANFSAPRLPVFPFSAFWRGFHLSFCQLCRETNTIFIVFPCCFAYLDLHVTFPPTTKDVKRKN